MQHFLCFFPDPQGQGSLRPIFAWDIPEVYRDGYRINEVATKAS